MIKQLLRSRALMGILCVLLSGCSADKQPSQLETVLANMAKDVVIPMQAQALENPVPASEQVIQQGQQIFGACACIGVPIVSLSLNFEADPVFSSLPPGQLGNATAPTLNGGTEDSLLDDDDPLDDGY